MKIDTWYKQMCKMCKQMSIRIFIHIIRKWLCINHAMILKYDNM